jgi:Phage integrase family
VLNALLERRAKSPYSTDLDFLFSSVRFKGNKPLSPDSILEKSVRPALAQIGVVGRHIGWHSFRHSLATNLRSLGGDVKVAPESMRHSSCRTTLDIYTRAVDQQKREASTKVVEIDAAAGSARTSAPFRTLGKWAAAHRCRQIYVNKGDIGGGGNRERTILHRRIPCNDPKLSPNWSMPVIRQKGSTSASTMMRSLSSSEIPDGVTRSAPRGHALLPLVVGQADRDASEITAFASDEPLRATDEEAALAWRDYIGYWGT